MKWARICRAPIVVFLLLVLARHGLAHSGSVALAPPVTGLRVDGYFTDWPDHVPTYSIARAEYGAQPEDAADFTGTFRAAYDPNERALYLAIDFVDQSMVADEANAAAWDTQDGCEIYLNLRHGPRDLAIQHFARGRDRRADPTRPMDAPSGLAWQHLPGHHQLEWRIDLSEIPLTFDRGLVLGFDLVLCDKDEDGSFSWMSWGAGTNKLETPERRGDLVLVAPGQGTGLLRGNLRWRDGGGPAANVKAQVRATTDSSFATVVQTGADGSFAVSLPAGRYFVHGPQRLSEEPFAVEINAGQESTCFLDLNALQGLHVPVGKGRMVAAGPGIRQGLWQTFGSADGLSVRDIYALAQVGDGALWIGSAEGLLRFDGSHFTHFTEDDGLADLGVRALFADSEGVLWIGTAGGVLHYANGKSTKPLASGEDVVHSLAIAENGALWVGHERGLRRLDGRAQMSFTSADGLSGDAVRMLYFDSRGVLWAGTGADYGMGETVRSGLSRFDGERFTTLTTEDGLPDNRILSLVEDGGGALWIGTTYGLSHYDGRSFTNYTTEHGLPNQVYGRGGGGGRVGSG